MEEKSFYGIKENQFNEFLEFENMYLGRIITQHKDIYVVVTDKDEIMAKVSGKFIFDIVKEEEYPVVGDFVVVDRNDCKRGYGIIHKVLRRNTTIRRKRPDSNYKLQVIATNVDIVFICTSLNFDFNLRRLERYLSVVWDSNAMPIIITTKSDLCNDFDDKVALVEEVAFGVPIISTSIFDDSYKEVSKYLKGGVTAVFIGSSGVGKSSIINMIIGEEHFKTSGIREDDSKGRHTTTHREVFLLENQGIVIDTPGMRELGLTSSNVETTYEDIAEFANKCKFSNCTHTSEPGCMVLKAIENGDLSEERFKSYVKTKNEGKFIEKNLQDKERKIKKQMDFKNKKIKSGKRSKKVDY
ncbi:MAG: ribosome small subunit-dependent GTPase A [Lachnospirales bacterium]